MEGAIVYFLSNYHGCFGNYQYYVLNNNDITSLKERMMTLSNNLNDNHPLYSLMVAIIAVSQPSVNSLTYFTKASDATEFISEVYKYLEFFKNSEEYGWLLYRVDKRKMIIIKSNKYATLNKIDTEIRGIKEDLNVLY